MTDWASWISAISQLLFLLFFVFLFVGGNQRLQVYLWTNDIKAKLAILDSMRREAEKRTLDYMVRRRAREARRLLDRVKEFFVIPPVDLEPTDIIRRLEHLILSRTRRFREDFRESMPEASETERSIAETASEITAALDFIYRYVRHLLLTGVKTRNWILIMQLQLVMPMILKISETYVRALQDFLTGAPIGDSAGPMVALRLAGYDTRWRLVGEDRDTVVAEAGLEGRRLLIVKAKGPESNVGRPGYATKLVVKELLDRGERPSLIVTVDAALKLEGEDTGKVAEGVGAAIGDPGPEKIRFERIAAEHGIPLRAVIVKMSMEEAILSMRKPILEAVDRAVERVREIILRETRPGDTVVVVGVGNSIGVGQPLEEAPAGEEVAGSG